VDPTLAESLAAAGLQTLDELFGLADAERLDKATLPRWRQRLRLDLPGIGTCYLKRYTSPPLRAQLRRIAGGHSKRSTARIEWEQIRRLKEAGTGSVTNVAFGEEMSGLWERRSAILLAEVPGESLEKWVERCPERASPGWIRGLADFVARFHRAGYVHRDLYLCHVFVELRGQEPVFRLIDLARMMEPRFRRRRWLVKDLASLNYSTPPSAATAWDRLRFLKAYLGVRRLGPADRRLARQIAAKSQRIARHDARVRRAAGTTP
jgi:heptose I phosphotransferase